eukprot:TRINITY_DN16223_c3_g1_i1.p1 TRINITY_DN16223_c3_g1~~TRINITY_DN16223_c3_g1_i1.p1  ORF type:complete len:240 (+),score=38.02 TRINITY_DN16223_c3_g1_i1:37-756(+)
MAHLYQELQPQTVYVDKKSGFSAEKWAEAVKVSRTLYVGNLSFFTSEDQLHELFSKCGEVKRVVMGLNRFKKSPCGFCFVEYFTHEQAEQAVNLLNKTMFDDRVIRVDWDAGLTEGRQFGRGESGDQWRDDFRGDFDVARGGAGRNMLRKIEGLPSRQVYVGKRRQDHGRFGAAEQEEAKKRQRTEDGGKGGGPQKAYSPFGEQFPGLPMAFGSAANAFAGYQSGGKGKGKKGKGKGRD